ncbi:DUF4251 domain-containing protein [Maribacter chungangensis]|uniref:DUF4251 domain-containing protein n=1 Tax=Maribacter chungangensis TaxID=1069117 RepID=A0ABW3B455_9FLAO
MDIGRNSTIKEIIRKQNFLPMKRGLVLMLTCNLFLSCGSVNKVPEQEQSPSEFIRFMGQRSFEFSADTAHPMTTQAFNSVANAGLLPPGSTPGPIQLIGVSNYIKVYGDSVSGAMPFYGERQFGGGPLSKQGIEFDGIPDSYEQRYNEAKERYEIEFEISGETGRHLVNMSVFRNMAADVLVTGNQRNAIRFRGKVAAIESDKD